MPSIKRFGDLSFDSTSGELTGAGRVTRLTPQVAALLEVLVERAGSVVTRAELQARLWPDTTVEFDDGLNFCIRQLRVALDDDATAPKFIETLPKRGYRFLATVTADRPARAPRHRSRWPAVAVVVLVVVAATLLLWRRQQTDRHTPIVLGILPFATDATDPMMGAYRRRLYDQLVRDARAEQRWQLVTAPASGATHLLSGSLERDGNAVKLFVQLVVVGDQRKLWADDIVDGYAFAGNSTMTADRIEKAVARILTDSVLVTRQPARENPP